MNGCLEFFWETEQIWDAEAWLQATAESCAEAEGLTLPWYAQIRIVDNGTIRAVNCENRGIDSVTDVLSFPSSACSPDRTLGKYPALLRREMDDTGRCFLGDIVLCLPRAREQACEYGHSLRREMAYLTAHAMMHLFGYDHVNPEDKERMRVMEEKALNQAGIARVADEELIAMAQEAMQNSYSPYSHYPVGAALLTRDGRVFTGCNVENVSFGLTNCAERTALFKAVSEGAREFTVIAIAAEKSLPWPCGACRQVLSEFAPDLRVIAVWGDRKEESNLSVLLPHAFIDVSGHSDASGKE